MSNILQQGLEQLGFENDIIQQILEPLQEYVKELELFNSAYDLVGADTHDDIIIRHILDSLSAWKKISTLIDEMQNNVDGCDVKTVQLSDIGTGGGLPGIPLAITASVLYKDKVQLALVERMSKRCAFLENCVAILHLKNTQIINIELEKLEPQFTDIATFRAFRPLDKKMIKNLLRIVKTNGYIAAYKAKKEKIEEEMKGIEEFVPNYEIEKLNVPFLKDTERNLVIIKK